MGLAVIDFTTGLWVVWLALKAETKRHFNQLAIGVTCVVVGGLLGASLTQHYAVSNLAKSLQAQRDEEMLNSTRLGIAFLMEVQNELDANTSLMLNKDYGITLKLAEPHGAMDSIGAMMADAPELKTNAAERAGVAGFMKSFNVPLCHVDQMEVPTVKLADDVWKHGPPELADVSFDLLRKLSDYYMLVGRVNSVVEAIDRTGIEPGGGKYRLKCP